MIDSEVRKRYSELEAKLKAATDAAEPQRKALDLALELARKIQEEMEILIDGAEIVGHCEGCSAVIFEGDKHSPTVDAGPLCEECSPTYADMLAHPESFRGMDDYEGMTPAEAKEICDAHIASGGSLEDSMAQAWA